MVQTKERNNLGLFSSILYLRKGGPRTRKIACLRYNALLNAQLKLTSASVGSAKDSRLSSTAAFGFTFTYISYILEEKFRNFFSSCRNGKTKCNIQITINSVSGEQGKDLRNLKTNCSI